MSELKMKGIVVYATSFGATKGIVEEIVRILREENLARALPFFRNVK